MGCKISIEIPERVAVDGDHVDDKAGPLVEDKEHLGHVDQPVQVAHSVEEPLCVFCDNLKHPTAPTAPKMYYPSVPTENWSTTLGKQEPLAPQSLENPKMQERSFSRHAVLRVVLVFSNKSV